MSENNQSPDPPTPLSDVDELDVDELDVDSSSDHDSALDSVIDSTTSLSSSIQRYRLENGRTYHSYKDGVYAFPNDDPEQDRLNMQHNLMLLTLENKLFLCPAGQDKEVKNVLDVGTGTGAWAIDFADDHPSAHITGVDLSPMQPSYVPPNVSFQIDDIESEWTFTSPFDFIHCRFMTAAIANWPRFFENAYDNLEPGGWLEVSDVCPLTSDDGTLNEKTAAYRWMSTMTETCQKIGRPCDSAFRYKEQMIAAGFKNVRQVKLKWPQNPWPKDRRYKELGLWTLENMSAGVEGFSLAVFTRVLGWSLEEVQVLAAQVRQDFADHRIHSYWPIWVTYGQKV